MDWFQALVLAIIQGLTEFLPVSSSGHLVLPAVLLGWRDQGLAFDVAIHMGTLAAVLWYFRADLQRLVGAWLGSLQGRHSDDSRLAWWIGFATVPAGLAGLLFHREIEEHLRSIEVLATTTLVFGLLLGLADWTGRRNRDLAQMTLLAALLIGLAQMLSLIPGVSRSGITLTAALMLGFNRVAAARFSFLMSIPIILAAGLLQGLELTRGQFHFEWSQLVVATLVSGVTGYLCIHWFLQALARVGMWPFVIYRLLLGGVLVAVAIR